MDVRLKRPSLGPAIDRSHDGTMAAWPNLWTAAISVEIDPVTTIHRGDAALTASSPCVHRCVACVVVDREGVECISIPTI